MHQMGPIKGDDDGELSKVTESSIFKSSDDPKVANSLEKAVRHLRKIS